MFLRNTGVWQKAEYRLLGEGPGDSLNEIELLFLKFVGFLHF